MLTKKSEHFVLHKAILKNIFDAHCNNKQNAIVESIHAGVVLPGSTSGSATASFVTLGKL